MQIQHIADTPMNARMARGHYMRLGTGVKMETRTPERTRTLQRQGSPV